MASISEQVNRVNGSSTILAGLLAKKKSSMLVGVAPFMGFPLTGTKSMG